MLEAWDLIKGSDYDVDRHGDSKPWTIDGMTVTNGQVVELAMSLGKAPLAKD